MNQSAFITGNSTGLGYGLTEEYLSRGWTVYGLSRRGCKGLDGTLHDVRCDLASREAIVPCLESLLGDIGRLDVGILNAGILGEIREITKTSLDDILKVMDINVWANKIILDWLHKQGTSIDQIVLISSGAAVNGHKGWGGYSLSKAALNMLARLYAHEFPDTHLCAFAPGLVYTAMQDDLRDVDPNRFPSVKKLHEAIGTDRMPSPREAAKRIVTMIPRLKDYPTGSFVDIRTI